MKAVAAPSAFAAPAANGWAGTGGDEPADDTLPRDDDDALTGTGAGAALPSFDEIYDQHLVFVWRTLRALGVAQPLLDDAVQDVFVVVHRRLFTFEGRSKVTTWLFGIALRVARNYRRVQRPIDDLSDVEDRLHDDRPSPFDETARSEAVQLLERVIDALDDKKRVVFVLMEIEQMHADDVAVLVGVNVNTIYSRRRAARIEFDRLVALHGKRAR